MDAKSSLALAVVDDDDEFQEQQQQYLIFRLGDESYALGLLSVKEIIEYGGVTQVPMMPPFVRGVINLRGRVVPVIDLAQRLYGEKAAVTQFARRSKRCARSPTAFRSLTTSPTRPICWR